jgi:murein DD-endopeptidase MepM/ murein hydrolase activator NlpD
MRLPFDGRIRLTSPYGYRTDPVTGVQGAWHGGLDLVGEDYVIRSVVPGNVIVSQIVTNPNDRTSEWGNYVCVLGDDGNYIYYCHMADRRVRAGQRVAAGDILGIMGSTGKSTGDHLHFEVRTARNQQINAAEYLGIDNAVGLLGAPEAPVEESNTAWSDEAVAWAVANGIIYGDGNGNLMLDEPCTRRQMVTFLHRFAKLMGRA